eukprot:tig00020553_g10528.t1
MQDASRSVVRRSFVRARRPASRPASRGFDLECDSSRTPTAEIPSDTLLGQIALLPAGIVELVISRMARTVRVAMLGASKKTRQLALESGSSGWKDALFVDDLRDAHRTPTAQPPRRLLAGREDGASIPLPRHHTIVAVVTSKDVEGKWICAWLQRSSSSSSQVLLRYGPDGRGERIALPMDAPRAETHCKDSVAIRDDGTVILEAEGRLGWWIWPPGAPHRLVKPNISCVVACCPSPDGSRVAICRLVGRRLFVRFVDADASAATAEATPDVDAGSIDGDSDSILDKFSRDLVHGLNINNHPYNWMRVEECGASHNFTCTWNACGRAVLVTVEVWFSVIDIDGHGLLWNTVLYIASVAAKGLARACWWAAGSWDPKKNAVRVCGLGENWLLLASTSAAKGFTHCWDDDVGKGEPFYLYYFVPPVLNNAARSMLRLRMRGVPINGWSWFVPVGDWSFIYAERGDRPFLVTLLHGDDIPLFRDLPVDLHRHKVLLRGYSSLFTFGLVGRRGLVVCAQDHRFPASLCGQSSKGAIKYVPWAVPETSTSTILNHLDERNEILRSAVVGPFDGDFALKKVLANMDELWTFVSSVYEPTSALGPALL